MSKAKEENEEWRDIKEYKGLYQVSSMGNVKSLDRTNRVGAQLVLMASSQGYPMVRLYKLGIMRHFSVHRLVFESFYPSHIIKDGFVVNHINGNKSDNRLINLEVVTIRDNVSTCYRKDGASHSSKHVGVWQEKGSKSWRAAIYVDGYQHKLGYFKREAEASEAYQKALFMVSKGEFNPPKYKRETTSRYVGVHFKKESQKWVAQIYVKRKPIYLGSFSTELEAHNAYQNALKDIITQTTLANFK